MIFILGMFAVSGRVFGKPAGALRVSSVTSSFNGKNVDAYGLRGELPLYPFCVRWL